MEVTKMKLDREKYMIARARAAWGKRILKLLEFQKEPYAEHCVAK